MNEEKIKIDESEMYNSFELFQKFLTDRSSLTPGEIIELNAMGINFD